MPDAAAAPIELDAACACARHDALVPTDRFADEVAQRRERAQRG